MLALVSLSPGLIVLLIVFEISASVGMSPVRSRAGGDGGGAGKTSRSFLWELESRTHHVREQGLLVQELLLLLLLVNQVVSRRRLVKQGWLKIRMHR